MTYIQAIQAGAANLYASLPSMTQISASASSAGATLQGFGASAYAALPSMTQISAAASTFKAAALTPQGAMIAAAVVVTAVILLAIREVASIVDQFDIGSFLIH